MASMTISKYQLTLFCLKLIIFGIDCQDYMFITILLENYFANKNI
jgi:hypothetical protein